MTGNQQSADHKQHGKQRFHAGDDDGSRADPLEVAQLEFVADREGDEAQSHVGDQRDAVKKILRQQTQHGRADEKTGHQITGDVGQAQMLCHPSAEHTGKDHQRQVGECIEYHM